MRITEIEIKTSEPFAKLAQSTYIRKEKTY